MISCLVRTSAELLLGARARFGTCDLSWTVPILLEELACKVKPRPPLLPLLRLEAEVTRALSVFVVCARPSEEGVVRRGATSHRILPSFAARGRVGIELPLSRGQEGNVWACKGGDRWVCSPRASNSPSILLQEKAYVWKPESVACRCMEATQRGAVECVGRSHQQPCAEPRPHAARAPWRRGQ